MKKFLLKILIYIALLTTIMLSINFLYIHNKADIDSDIEAFANGVPDNIQICNFGSSHGLYGFNYEDIEKKYTCFNFALSSQSLMYDYRILLNFKNKIKKDSVVFIVIPYFSFLGKTEIEGKDFTSKNRRYYKILPRDLIEQYDWETDAYVNYLPSLIATPGDLLKNILSLKLNKNNQWDKEADAPLAYKDAQEAYERHIVTDKIDKNGERIYRQEAFNAIYSMINLLKEIGARPIFITTPFLSEYTDAIKNNAPEFFSEFYSVVNEIVKNTEVKYYDYSHDKRFRNDYSLFMNSDHLNRKGARKFTNILMREVLGFLE
ncbi:MAG: hypothetical protein SPL10_04805 [Synergistales bacterium]|nr:hypothetical protein [Synergistales bacterium]MDY6402121.1 hypothetical protein [Synergistales bacterium]MDY6404346.1 hypothetical protein [Synergistales bacterium]MDY6410623.1 hypothetical protein [Synergistales bacterium]MDY6414461.1 hypothetical protein [Synergistales bacterium]